MSTIPVRALIFVSCSCGSSARTGMDRRTASDNMIMLIRLAFFERFESPNIPDSSLILSDALKDIL
jgi:hypothetical protein